MMPSESLNGDSTGAVPIEAGGEELLVRREMNRIAFTQGAWCVGSCIQMGSKKHHILCGFKRFAATKVSCCASALKHQQFVTWSFETRKTSESTTLCYRFQYFH